MKVNFSRTSPHHGDLQVRCNKVEYVDKAIILGPWLQNDLELQTQVDVMFKEVNKNLFMLKASRMITL